MVRVRISQVIGENCIFLSAVLLAVAPATKEQGQVCAINLPAAIEIATTALTPTTEHQCQVCAIHDAIKVQVRWAFWIAWFLAEFIGK